jgi:hypothetical protein
MRRIGFILTLFVMFMYSVCTAVEENCYDPLERNLIFVEGQAEITVPVDYFAISFGFDIEKPSFSESSNESARIMNAVGENAKKLGLADVEIIKGWDLLRQSKISIGSKGKRISNMVTVRVKNFPVERMHELIARIIDESLALNSSIALDNIEVSVSEEMENKKKAEVTAGALKALQENATRAAQAIGKTAVIPKRIFITSDQAVMAQDYEAKSKYEYGGALAQRSFVSFQKSFRVKAQVSDTIKISAKVSGVYQIE